MKIFLLGLLVMGSAALAFGAENYPVDYNCVALYGQYRGDDIKLTVVDTENFLINGVDEATLDERYKPTAANSGYKKLSGELKSIGDGADGFAVTLLVNSYLIDGANYGYMKYRASGPEGYYSDTFKCTQVSR